jgi:hypothetical protein
MEAKIKTMKKFLLSVLTLLAFAGSGTAQNLPSYVPANGLVGWWPFNGNANDESGNNNNGTVNGATLTADRFGNAGKAYEFNGSSYIISTQVSNIPLGNSPRTFSFWMKSNITTSPSNRDMINWGTTALSQRFGFVMYDGLPYFVGEGDDFYGSTPIGNNNWHFIVLTYTGSVVSIYIDGDLDASQNKNLNTIGPDLVIGRSALDHPLFTTYAGLVDDVGIWNRALTQQEITALYQGANTTANCLDLPSNLQQGLVGYWPFCGNALDESGNNNHGTVNGATLTTDRFGNQGSAYGFDGTNYISVPNSSTFSFDSSNNFSIAFWQKKTNTSNDWQVMLSHACSNGNGYGGYQLGLNGNLSFELGTTANEIFNGGDIQVDNWNFITLTMDRQSDTAKIFQNGSLVGKQIVLPNQTYSPTCSPSLLFGAERNYWNQYYFNGLLDDIAIWNRALSQQEITQLYNQGVCQTSITVTDTLLIHTGITSYNPVAYQNTLKVWPNPGNQDITLDAGNLSLMQGWKIKISNSLGQEVYPATLISQQQQVLDMSTWGGNGLYLLHLINPQGHITEVKKIVLAP